MQTLHRGSLISPLGTCEKEMPSLNYSVKVIVIAVILAAALGSMGVLLYYGEDPSVRLGVGLLLIGVIMWTSAHLGIVEWVSVSVGRPFKRRQFHLLRSLVDQFISDVRRLNWMVIDAERGVRPKESMQSELDALEEELHQQVRRIRDACGKESAESEIEDDQKQ